DNDFKPSSIGSACSLNASAMSFPGPTIGDVLSTAGVSWSFYIEGYQAMVDSNPDCPPAPHDCPFAVSLYPCNFDPSDITFAYYDNLKDDPRLFKDFGKLAADLDSDSLPQVVFVKGLG